MKKFNQILVVAFLLCVGGVVKGQTADSTDTEKFFIGKWKLMVYGLPNGDTEMFLNIVKSDGKLGGTIGGGGANDSKLTKVEINKNTLSVNFIGEGYNVPMYLDQKEDDKVEGSMNDMFDVEGAKVKEEK